MDVRVFKRFRWPIPVLLTPCWSTDEGHIYSHRKPHEDKIQITPIHIHTVIEISTSTIAGIYSHLLESFLLVAALNQRDLSLWLFFYFILFFILNIYFIQSLTYSLHTII